MFTSMLRKKPSRFLPLGTFLPPIFDQCLSPWKSSLPTMKRSGTAEKAESKRLAQAGNAVLQIQSPTPKTQRNNL